jgi:hypothetical protein
MSNPGPTPRTPEVPICVSDSRVGTPALSIRAAEPQGWMSAPRSAGPGCSRWTRAPSICAPGCPGCTPARSSRPPGSPPWSPERRSRAATSTGWDRVAPIRGGQCPSRCRGAVSLSTSSYAWRGGAWEVAPEAIDSELHATCGRYRVGDEHGAVPVRAPSRSPPTLRQPPDAVTCCSAITVVDTAHRAIRQSTKIQENTQLSGGRRSKNPVALSQRPDKGELCFAASDIGFTPLRSRRVCSVRRWGVAGLCTTRR